MNRKTHALLGIIILLMIMLSGTAIGCSQDINAVSSVPEQEDTSSEKAYLELHFGNQTTWKQEVRCIYIPNKITRTYISDKKCYALEISSPYVWANSSVELLDGKIYSFSDAYDMQFDEEENTIHLYLWRDEPSDSEMEEFDFVEQEE